MSSEDTQDGAKRAVNPVVFPPLLFLGALLAGVALDFVLPLSVFAAAWVGHAVGWPVFLLGFLLAWWGERTMVAAKVSPRFTAVDALVNTGLFRYTRNPLYVTVGIGYAGLALVFNTVWPLLLLPIVFLILHFGVVLREERYLHDRFGEAYRDYCARVRRWL